MQTLLKESIEGIDGRSTDSGKYHIPQKNILEAYSDFSRDYLMARCYSPKTIDTYWFAVKSFIDSAGNIKCIDLDLPTYSKWVQYMQEKGNKKLTIHTNISRFRIFIEYLNLQGWCFLGKEQIKLPKKPRSNVKYATKDEVEILITHANGIRNKALIAVMFSGAFRNAEIRNLRKSDIINADARIEHGKGDKDRVVFLSDTARDLLNKYWASRTDNLPWAFVAGEDHTAAKVASSTLRYIFAETCRRAGISPISPKMVRHGTATELMKNKMHIRYIQEYLGHEFVTTTQIYTHIEPKDLRNEALKILNST